MSRTTTAICEIAIGTGGGTMAPLLVSVIQVATQNPRRSGRTGSAASLPPCCRRGVVPSKSQPREPAAGGHDRRRACGGSAGSLLAQSGTAMNREPTARPEVAAGIPAPQGGGGCQVLPPADVVVATGVRLRNALSPATCAVGARVALEDPDPRGPVDHRPADTA